MEEQEGAGGSRRVSDVGVRGNEASPRITAGLTFRGAAGGLRGALPALGSCLSGRVITAISG